MATGTGTTVLRARQLSVSIGAVSLLEEIDLRVNAGEVLAIIGPNGAGKTSLIRVLTGDLPPAGGQLLGNITQLNPQQRARSLAVLPQQTVLNFPFTAEEVVHLGRMPHATGARVDAAVVQAALAEMDISYLRRRIYTRLSSGEKQRVQLARVMAQVWRQQDTQQRILILDEPTAALDIAHQQRLMQALRRFADKGAAVVMIVHDFNIASRYADQILALCRGRIAMQGPPARVISETSMRQLFAVETTVIKHPGSGCPVVLVND